MSYILDAIKKADQKRKLGTIPDVHTEHEVPLDEPPRRPGWLYGLAAILIVNAGGIGWWLWSGTPTKTPVAQQLEKSAAVQPTGQAKPAAGQTAKINRKTVSRPPSTPAAKDQTIAAGKQRPSAPLKVVSPGPPAPAAKIEQPPTVVGGVSSIIPPPGAQTPGPSGEPAGHTVVQSGTAIPPPVAPSQASRTGEQEVPATQKATNLATGPSAVKIEEAPPAAGGVVRPPPPPPTAQTRMAEGKAVSRPAGVQSGEAEEVPVAPPPPTPAAKQLPTVAPAGKGRMVAVDPSGEASSAAVVPVLEPDEEDVAAEPDEPLNEVEEAPAVDAEADTETIEAEADDQTLTPIATSPEREGKLKKADKEDEEDPELAKIPFLRQLPAEVQQSIPELHISFHAYSIKPSSRLVSIEGKILREGQEAGENLTLERITIKGVVLDYNGRRFRLEM